jgi:hypothetical protein
MTVRAASHLNNKPLTDEQQAAFDASCTVISRSRSKELLQLYKWKNGGCLAGLERPDIGDVSREEDAAIKSFWMTLPGWTCWNTSLELLSRDPRKQSAEGGLAR